MNSYKTIRNEAQDEFIEKHSRFIGYIKPVTTQEQATQFINEIKSRHWDATHNVYAYILREGQVQRYSDDGEPQGTAGVPTLDVLKKEGLTDCVVVVTRYFGGTLLGAGGLVRAYSHGAKIAVDAGGVVTMAPCKILRVKCDYNFYGKLLTLIEECSGTVEDSEFSDNVDVMFRIPADKTDMFDERLTDRSFGKFASELFGEVFAAVD